MPDDKKITSPIKAIRAYCIGCMCGSAMDVKLCPCKECELYAFRFGTNPYRTKREYSEEQKAELEARFSKSDLSKNSP